MRPEQSERAKALQLVAAGLYRVVAAVDGVWFARSTVVLNSSLRLQRQAAAVSQAERILRGVERP